MKRPAAASLVLALCTALISCGGTPPISYVEPDPAGLAGQVSGTLTDPTIPTATIVAQAKPTPGEPSTYVTLSSAAVDADGSFTLPLPSAAAVAPYLTTYPQTAPAGCTGSILQTVKAARHFTLSTYGLLRADGSLAGMAGQTRPLTGTTENGEYLIIRVYADQPVTVSGDFTCPDHQLHVGMNLKRGWNAVRQNVEVTSDRKVTTTSLYTTNHLPDAEFLTLGVSDAELVAP